MVLLAVLPFLLVSSFAIAGAFQRGGAGSPEDAVTNFIEAAADQDALAVVSAMDPTELRIFKPITTKAADKFGGLDFGGTDGADDESNSSVTVRVRGLKVSPVELRPGVARVDVVAGTLVVRTDSEELPFELGGSSEPGAGSGPRTEEVDLATLVADATEDSSRSTYLVALERGGRWYVSIAATAAEYAREASGYAFTPGLDPSAGGAASADEAITSFVSSLPGTDLRATVGLLAPGTYRVLYDYVGVIETWMHGDGASEFGPLTVLGVFGGAPEGDYYCADYYCDDYSYDVDADDPRVAGVTVTVKDLVTSKDDLGDGLIRVTLQSFGVTVTDREGDEETVTYADRCVTGSDGERECLDEESTSFRFPDPAIVVAEAGGRYYVDPLATVVDYVGQMLDQVGDADIACLQALIDADTASDYDESERLAETAELICEAAPLGQLLDD
ncbi:hypothetical protein I6A84_08665 [Frankia sp. CNm7]|uniref:hypothetical protein n=1 Tax=Frankia nepalensis TaxID=1836974 RepID=UPI001934A294|nr:hypothetical protein [Frankia nepalensis]MBL7502526.1 hypothetical protein [Frankia nepalensis]MBL7518185.1 hypothetical protein [Frankia nepalensis]